MATATDVSKAIVMKYEKGSFRFSHIALTAGDPHMYILADVLNAFQADPMTQVIKVTTKLIV